MSNPDRIKAEIEAGAEEWRLRDPEIVQLEQNIACTWGEVAPSDNATEAESLIEQAERLSMITPNVPIGSRFGVRRIKWLIRRLTYFYARFITDQFNTFAGRLTLVLRQQEERLDQLEVTVGFAAGQSDQDGSHPADRYPTGSDLLDAPPEPSPAVARAVADLVGPGRCVVFSGGEGSIVDAVASGGGEAYGVEQDTHRVLAGMRREIDVRPGEILASMAQIDDDELSTVVLTGVVETLSLATLLQVIDQAGRALDASGRIVVAVPDPAARDRVESELRAGLGVGPATWQHLLNRAGFSSRIEPCVDPRIPELVVAERSCHSG